MTLPGSNLCHPDGATYCRRCGYLRDAKRVRIPELSIRGVVSLDGDTVYVNGMHLADLLAAFVPVRDSTTGGWYLNITITDLGA